jgi:hypothetical protein
MTRSQIQAAFFIPECVPAQVSLTIDLALYRGNGRVNLGREPAMIVRQ